MKSEFAGALPVIRGWLPGTMINGRPARVPIVQAACRHRPEIAALRGVHRPEPPVGLWPQQWECIEVRGAHLEALTIEGETPISCKFQLIFRYYAHLEIIQAMICTEGLVLCTTPPEVLPSGELRILDALFFQGHIERLGEFLEQHTELKAGTTSEDAPAHLHDNHIRVTIPIASEQPSV